MSYFKNVKIICTILLWKVAVQSCLSSFYEITPTIEAAYQQIIALKIDSGRYFLEQESSDNHIKELLYSYIDFFEVYTNGSENTYNSVKEHFNQRIKAVKSFHGNSPWHDYVQAEMHLHAAILHLKYKEYVKALFDVKKALKKTEENVQKYPSFLPSQKTYGMLLTVLGTIPDQYTTGLKLFGLYGNIEKGMNLLNQLIQTPDTFLFKHETTTIYAFLLFHIENNPSAAWSIIEKEDFFSKNNLMDYYTVGHIGIYGSQNDKSIDMLMRRPAGSEYAPFPHLDYLLGIGKTYRQDADANLYFERFLSQYNGEDYIKSAYHKMAWNELIQNDTLEYQKYMLLADELGRNMIDADKQAERELSSGIVPNTILLQARLLTDGNYLDKALQLLDSVHVNSFEEVHYKTEYFYRLGRVYDKKGDTESAKKQYLLTIQHGQSIAFYYASNAAYLLGYVYERENNEENALYYYRKSMAFNGYEYEHSIDQKAKAGINRILNH